MHRLPNQQAVSRFRLAALLLICNRVLIVAIPILLVYSLVIEDPALTHLILALMSVPMSLTVILWVLTARLRCPLCIGLPFAISGSVKSRLARSLLGTYSLRVATSILMQGHFRCPYCGEFTAVEVRRPRHR
ncbi:MAG: hypothetical protein DVB25_02145 [Verrucomicrobia bacterium]|nr:MAG: hypothetical protein DVB25_02145 [Verrucomicrobiota bacterium]